ncbi:glutamate ABC transporter substrate-binding protein [Streptomyces sp. NPDC002580]|uniref:glutamate ABC transporter substrate-binding protein n=1 Tax=Streptomyces sp. NPDC002580 TaxID=3364653 RepID=UPI0036A50001
MIGRRLRASLRGWGGVGAMAAACAITLVLALLLPLGGARGQDGTTDVGGQGVARGTQARAKKCVVDPQDRSPAPSGADGPTIDAIKSRGRLIVGVDQNSYRWGYRDPNNLKSGSDLEGFDIDLVHAIAEDILGDPKAVQFRAVPTARRVEAIQKGEVDMVVRTMTITCKRLDDVVFSAPYFQTGQQVLAPTASKITGRDESLAGKRICTAASSTANEQLVEDRRKGRLVSSAKIIKPVPNQLDCLVRLQLGLADAVVTDGALAASQAAQDPTVQLKGGTFTTEYYGVAMKKGPDDDLVRRVNKILADYRESGWGRSYDKWLAPTLGEKSPSRTPPVPHYKQPT